MPSVVVLGAGPGLGAATARAFAARGYRVGVLARSGERVAALVDELSAVADQRVVGRAGDAADPADLDAVLRALIADLGGLDVLHHNISRWRGGGVLDTDPRDLAEDLAIGVISLLSAVRTSMEALQASRGTVLVTGGGAADRPPSSALTLGPQKAGVRALAKAMAADLSGRGVRVATLTVRGFIERGTPFDPDLIAERLVSLADLPPQAPWSVEVDHPGSATSGT